MENLLLKSPDHLFLLQDLAVVTVVAAVAMIVFRQMRQPVVLGYILAGLLIGPHTPPISLISDRHTIETMAELGVIFLMFSLGLEFNLGKLKRVGPTALLGAGMEIFLMIAVGYQLGRFFGWNQMDSIFLGAILSVSSTTIIVKALDELGKIKERFAGLIFGILIVEDIMSIAMIALLSGLAATGTLAPAEVGWTLLELSAFLAILLIGGLLFIPRLIGYVAKFNCDEVLLVTVIGICFGVALLTAKLGYSVALGAFLIGAIISEATAIHKVERLIRPVRDLFSAVFFVSIGLLIDPKIIVQYWMPVLIISAVVVIGKVISCGLGAFLAGNDSRTSLRVGMGLSQIGEFSFIMAGLGVTLKATSEFLYPITVAVSAITTLSTPYLIRSSDGLVGWFDRSAPRPLVNWMEMYSRWVGQSGTDKGRNVGLEILKRVVWQMALNLLVMTAVFIGARVLYENAKTFEPLVALGEEALRSAVWLLAMVLTLPLLVASWRKFEAAGLTIAELSIPPPADKPMIRQAVVLHTVKMAGGILLLIFVLLLNATLLPSWPMVVLLAVVVLIAAIFFYRTSVRIYAKVQYTLHDTFAQPPDEEERSVPGLLREAHMESVSIPATILSAPRTIGDLQLRSITGASIVGIERAGQSLINPEPDQVLQVGDLVLLIGTPAQLQAARDVLTGSQRAS